MLQRKASKSLCRSLSKFLVNFPKWSETPRNRIKILDPLTPPLTLSIFLDFMEDNGRKWNSKLVIFVGFTRKTNFPLTCLAHFWSRYFFVVFVMDLCFWKQADILDHPFPFDAIWPTFKASRKVSFLDVLSFSKEQYT